MTKKEYQKPVMEILEADLDQLLLAYSVQNDGLDDDNLALPEAEERKSVRVWEESWQLFVPLATIIRGRSTFVCFVPEFLHQIQYIPKESLDSPLH